jgi:hypothetical protein
MSWMIGSSTASTISITTTAHATMSSGSRMVASCHGAALHLGADSWVAARCSISGSWPVCSPRRANIASRPGKALLGASRRGQRRAFAHLHQRVQRVGAHGAVGQRLGRRLQALRIGTPAPASMASVPAKRAAL